MPKNWVEFLLDAFHCPDLPHGYPTPASPLRFQPAWLALRGWTRAPRSCRAPCSPPTSGTHSYRHPHRRGRPGVPTRRNPNRVRTGPATSHYRSVRSGRRSLSAGARRQLQHGSGHLEWPNARSPCHLLVRCPRRLQYARDYHVGLPGWHGPRHDDGSVLASHGSHRARISACRGRGHFSTRRSGPRSAKAALLQWSAITAIPVGQIPEGLSGLLARAPLADALGYLHLDVDVLDPAVGHANYLPAPNGLSLPHLTAAIAVVRARVPLGAAALTSYSPEDDHDQGVCRAAFAAIDAIVANGA